MMRIGKRLETISEMVDGGSVVADVGSDHGLLLLRLREKKTISKGFGIENKQGPFRILEKSLRLSLDSQLVALLQGGISQLSSEVDTLILAGLGGESIINILEDGKENLTNIKTIITDAHSSAEDVRRHIVGLGYIIIDECLIHERGIYYQIVKFAKSAIIPSYTNFEYKYGPIISHDISFKAYANKLISDIDSILAKDIPISTRVALEKEKEALQHHEY